MRASSPILAALLCAAAGAALDAGEGHLQRFGDAAERAGTLAAGIWERTAETLAALPIESGGPRLLLMRWPAAIDGEDAWVQLALGGEVDRGLCYAPGWNAAVHEVAISDRDETPGGTGLRCRIAVASDGARPPPGKGFALDFACELEIADGRISGRATTIGSRDVWPNVPRFEARVRGVVLEPGRGPAWDGDLQPPPQDLHVRHDHARVRWYQHLAAECYRLARAARIAVAEERTVAAVLAAHPDRRPLHRGYALPEVEDDGPAAEEDDGDGGDDDDGFGVDLDELDEIAEDAARPDRAAGEYDRELADRSLPALRAALAYLEDVAALLADREPAVTAIDGVAATGDAAFGPWYGGGILLDQDTGANRLPDFAADARPRWGRLGGWRILGPFPDRAIAAAGLPPVIASAHATYVVPGEDGGRRSWEPIAVEPATGLVKWDGEGIAVRHLAADLHAPAAGRWWIGGGVLAEEGVLRCNGRVVGRSAGTGAHGELLVPLRLREGRNRLLLTVRGGAGAAWLRVCVAGAPVEGRVLPAAATAARDEVVAYRGGGGARFPGARPPTAWDLDRGINVRWRTPFVGSSKGQPLAVGDLVLVQEDPHFLVACDRETGTERWRVHHSAAAAHDPDAASKDARLHRAWRDAERALQAAEGEGVSQSELAPLRKARKAAHDAWWGHYRSASGCPKSSPWDGAPHGPWVGYTYATPVADGEHVWVKCGTGVVACYSLAGERRWIEPLDLPVGGHDGLCPSPVLAGEPGDRVFVVPVVLEKTKRNVAGTRGALIGFDAASGEQRWRTVVDVGTTESPVAARLPHADGAVEVVITGPGAIVRATDGAVLRRRLLGDPSSCGPSLGDGLLVRQGWKYGLGAAHHLFALDADTVGARPRWMVDGVACAGGWALHDGLAYALQGSQFGGRYRVLDLADGRPVPRGEHASVDGIGAFQAGGDAYVPTTCTDEVVFVANRGPRDRRVGWAGVTVVQTGRDGRYLAFNRFENYLGAPLLPDGDSLFVRNDRFLTRIAHTGDEGRAWEARVNAGVLLDDFEAVIPRPVPAKEVAADGPVRGRGQRWVEPPALTAIRDWNYRAPLSREEAGRLMIDARSLEGRRLDKQDAELVDAATTTWRRRGPAIDCAALADGGEAVVFERRIPIAAARTVRLILPGEGVAARIGAVEVAHGDRLHLAAGTHRIRVLVPLDVGTFFFQLLPSPDADAAWAAWKAGLARSADVLDRAAAADPGLRERIEALRSVSHRE